MSADEAVRLVKSGDHIYCMGSTAIPVVLQSALARRASELRDVVVYSAFNVPYGECPLCKPEYKDSFITKSLFLSGDQRKWVAQGYGEVIPAFLGEIPFLFRSKQLPLDVTFLNCSPPDKDGYCSYGMSADLAFSAVEMSKTIIAQINDSMPYLCGAAKIHESQIAAAVRCDEPPLAMEFGSRLPLRALLAALSLPRSPMVQRCR